MPLTDRERWRKSPAGPRDEEERPTTPCHPLPPLHLHQGDTTSPQPHPQSSDSQCSSDVEGGSEPPLGGPEGQPLTRQHRPSVLRQGVRASPRQPHAETDTGDQASPRPTCPSVPPRRNEPNQTAIMTRQHHSHVLKGPGGADVLFVNGVCRWPHCDTQLQDIHSFLKHLRSEHTKGDRSIAEWRVQRDMVQYMERQLILEKQKLFAMQLHLHLSEHKATDLREDPDWAYGQLIVAQPQAADAQGDPSCESEPFAWHGYWAEGTGFINTDLLPAMECYRFHNIRPPYTYACLIRWSILESAEKQRTLNEIYHWFTSMFFYFRHNSATWKNAVRHNLSLHKCFQRVEGSKGAVWTVDETEYQRRRGQKYYRNHLHYVYSGVC